MNLIEAISNLKSARILVVGDLLLDKYVWGDVDRISPEAPIQIVSVKEEEYRPGGAANVARNIASLGGCVTCLGCIGNDQNGKILVSLLKKSGVNTAYITTDKTKPTPLKTRIIAHNQQVLRIDNELPRLIDKSAESQLIGYLPCLSKKFDSVVFSDYTKGTLTSALTNAIIGKFHYRKPIFVGLKSRDYKKYKGVTCVTLNRKEIQLISGMENLKDSARWLMRELSLPFLVVTLGEKGISLFIQNRKTLTLPAFAKEVYDVTGAGDTVLAGLSISFASGNLMEDSLALGNLAGSIVVGKVGTETVTKEELVEFLRESSPSNNKILTTQTLEKTLKGLRLQGKKIVFTNGCFDILHQGHIRTLDFAKSKGDVLILGLNSDKSIRAIKGPSRPINSQDARCEILQSIETVDFVVIFDEKTPAKLIRKIKPDVLVKGGDWKGKKIVGEDFVKSYGGKIEFAPLVPTVSTTEILRHLKI